MCLSKVEYKSDIPYTGYISRGNNFAKFANTYEILLEVDVSVVRDLYANVKRS